MTSHPIITDATVVLLSIWTAFLSNPNTILVLLSIILVLVRLYETNTFQCWLRKRKCD